MAKAPPKLTRADRILALMRRIVRLQANAHGARYQELEAQWDRAAYLLGKLQTKERMKEYAERNKNA